MSAKRKVVGLTSSVLAATAALLIFTNLAPPSTSFEGRTLRICSDPNNLPFSNERLEGFENRLAELVADELNADLAYFWWAQRRGAIRNTLQARECDLIMGLPTSVDRALTTVPYYRSGYVFVTRADRGLRVDSFESPSLRQLRIGVHVIGDDFASTPPVHALERRRMIANIVGYRLIDDYSRPDPPARLLDAVVNGEVDVAVAWGPLAGYFTKRRQFPFDLTAVPSGDDPSLPMVYDISMAVRHEERNFRDQLNRIVDRRRGDIERILDTYGIPRFGGDDRVIPLRGSG